MEVRMLRSDRIYTDIMKAPPEKKDELYRYGLMMPFKKKWDCFNIPMKAAKPGGYDILMASGMLGHLPPQKIDASREESIRLLSDDTLWERCRDAICRSLACFPARGITLPVSEYLFTVLLADEENPYIRLCNGYTGDGGIPGYPMVWLTPNDYTISRLPAALAHETNHNVRYQFIRWRNDVTLGEMLVSEGLAENFSTSLFGEETAGPWVTKTDPAMLDSKIKPVIHAGLGATGLSELNAYLYGDEIALLQGYTPVGLPYCAGYACGYALVKHFLRKTGVGIAEATLLPAEKVLSEVTDFWGEPVD